MAEALVFVVLQKIAFIIGQEVVKDGISKIFKEASNLREIKFNIRQIQSEFVVIQGFLRKVDAQASSDPSFEGWLEQVKNIALDVEDIIDEFAYQVAQKRNTDRITKKTIYYFKEFKTWGEMVTRLKEVKGHLDHLTQMRVRYGITIPEGSNSNSCNHNRQLGVSDSRMIDEDEIVGNLEVREKLFQWLTDTYQDRAIISIYGMGGLGKTTITNAIYKRAEIKRKFECCAFIAVSQNFQLEELLRNIINQILQSDEINTRGIVQMDTSSLVGTICNALQNRRYLIVLDDMWKRESWFSLSQALPINNKGSRIVITTRIEDVACLAHKNWSIMMDALSENDAWELFNRKAFVMLENKTCPAELMGWAEKIVFKCDGLPLAIVAIGSLLSFKGSVETQWRLFYNQLSWELSNNPELSKVANILNLSYDNLPTQLKNCFLYCSLLPEDYLIRRDWIIRLLIAEGFIENNRGPNITMEEVAESYLVELAHRSLLQVVEMNIFGRAEILRMHDLVRDMCIVKAKSESFGIGCDTQFSQFDRKTRRIFARNISEDLETIVKSSKLRSIVLFKRGVLLSRIENTSALIRLLRVLSLRSANIESVPDVIFMLFNLHYLDLSFTKVKVIPKSIGKLRLLQTLELNRTSVENLPWEITKLSKLRHLCASRLNDRQFRQYDSYGGVSVPPNICDAEDLQSLHMIEANDELVVRLGRLINLRMLFILQVNTNHIEDLLVSITKIPLLSSLGIIARENEVLSIRIDNPLPNIETLYLKGKLEGGVIPPIFSRFSKMRELRLGWLGLREDPLSSFSHMSNLVQLHLYRIYEGDTLTFRSGWFPKLEMLYLVDMFELVLINIEDKTMESLHHLELIGLSKLTHVPQGMRFLRTLKNLTLTDMPQQFHDNLANEWSNFHSIIVPTGCRCITCNYKRRSNKN